MFVAATTYFPLIRKIGSSIKYSQTTPSYYDGDAAESGAISDDDESWMQTTVDVNDGDEMSFYWKVSSESMGDWLEFYIDAVRQDRISGNKEWQKKSYTFSGSGTKTLKWVYDKDSSATEGDDCGWVDGLVIGPGSLVPPPDELSEAMDCDLSFTTSGTGDYDTWSVSNWSKYYYHIDSAQSASPDDEGESCLRAIVESSSAETIKFYWKVSSEEDYDYLQFYIDSTLKDQISGEVDWTLKSYTVPAGTHTLKWRYVKDGSDYSGDDCGWVDFVQWTGPSPAQACPERSRRDPSNWQQIDYKHDVIGRRTEKKEACGERSRIRWTATPPATSMTAAT
ncbi:MAG: hypothetical protein ACYTEK_14695 [Planctomycetota bacterium]